MSLPMSSPHRGARPPAPRPGLTGGLELAPYENVLYALVAAVWVLSVALTFFGSMRQQILLLYASLAQSPLAGPLARLGPWSAPLDDVFIHFDVARSTARGYPFQWSVGNGYSSGGTSILYPMVLAVGYVMGFHRLWLMVWAAIVANVSVLGLLLAARRLFSGLPRAMSYLAPPAVLSVGALDWTLFSGMEVAFFLGLWGGALVAWDDLLRNPVKTGRRAGWLGVWCALLVATRPEAVTTVAVFALGAALSVRRAQGWRAGVVVTVLSATPAVLVVVGQALMNLHFTGETSSAGAVAKLEAFDPFRSGAQVWRDWWFFVTYQVDRVTQYHLADDARHGWLLWVVGLVPLVSRATRRYALLLWASAIAWVLIVGFNGQVRWQNERYTMPALAWLLLLGGMGVGILLSPWAWRGWRRETPRLITAIAALLTTASFLYHGRARFRDQVWFFGRASRNILEQHVQAGLLLRYALDPPPRRIAVGDAGAIPYVADLPALDMIGLGGYHDLPFARAKRAGLGAVLELVERMPPTERPDVMALYPSWWGDLPVWFGRPFAEVPVHGNVICGGASKVLYHADFSSFAGSRDPFGLPRSARIVDAVDVADLVDEQRHEYALSARHVGHVMMKLLPHPERSSVDLWDAARIVPPNVTESFVLRGFTPGREAHIVVRLAVVQPTTLQIRVGGRPLEPIVARGSGGWQHLSTIVPADATEATLAVEVQSQHDRASFHLWAAQLQ